MLLGLTRFAVLMAGGARRGNTVAGERMACLPCREGGMQEGAQGWRAGTVGQTVRM